MVADDVPTGIQDEDRFGSAPDQAAGHFHTVGQARLVLGTNGI